MLPCEHRNNSPNSNGKDEFFLDKWVFWQISFHAGYNSGGDLFGGGGSFQILPYSIACIQVEEDFFFFSGPGDASPRPQKGKEEGRMPGGITYRSSSFSSIWGEKGILLLFFFLFWPGRDVRVWCKRRRRN